VALGDAEAGEQEGNGLRHHGGAVVGVKGQLTRPDALAFACLVDERLGEFAGLTFGDHPADDEAREHIEDDVQVKVLALYEGFELGDVPTPQFPRLSRHQFGSDVPRVTELIAPLVHLAIVVGDAVHRSLAAQGRSG
jgi:hypothetical protein